jgi:hypothetical protein
MKAIENNMHAAQAFHPDGKRASYKQLDGTPSGTKVYFVKLRARVRRTFHLTFSFR